jgi:hypothetical protein
MIIDPELGEALAPHEAEAARQIAELIREQVSRRYPAGKRPARRDAHPKAHGCVRAEFQVERDLPSELAQGVFVPGARYRAWIRFSNGDGDGTRDDAKGDSRGMAIKLLGIPGEKLLEGERDEQTQDFLMINHPVFIVDDPEHYLSLIRRSESTNPLVRLAAPAAIGLRGALTALATVSAKIGSPLTTRYWSTTAYQLGVGPSKQAIKFSARPHRTEPSEVPDGAGPNFLREVLIRELEAADAYFDFLVQRRTSEAMSVESSSQQWSEAEAPFYKLATIRIPKQRFAIPAQDTFAENLSFTPWHSLPEHRPLGAVNRTRRVVYEAISRHRHELNGVAPREPTGDERFE